MRPGTEVEISSVVEKTRKRWVLAFEKKKKKKKSLVDSLTYDDNSTTSQVPRELSS